MLGGAVLALVLSGQPASREPRQAPPTSAIETPAQPDTPSAPQVDPQADLVTPPETETSAGTDASP
jgi:hypothetical protein